MFRFDPLPEGFLREHATSSEQQVEPGSYVFISNKKAKSRIPVKKDIHLISSSFAGDPNRVLLLKSLQLRIRTKLRSILNPLSSSLAVAPIFSLSPTFQPPHLFFSQYLLIL